MKRRRLLLILAAVMLLGVVSCGKEETSNTQAMAEDVENTEAAEGKTEDTENVQDTEEPEDAGNGNYTEAEPSPSAESRELVLECDSDTNVRVVVPAVFININQSTSSMAHVSAEDGKLSAFYKASSLSLDRATEEVTKQVIDDTEWEDCDEKPDISDRIEQDVNGQKCLWYKMSFSMNGEKRANIFGDVGSEDGESSISIMLFAEGEDAVNIVNDTWQNIISGIEFQ